MFAKNIKQFWIQFYFATKTNTMSIYRKTTLGDCLTDTLEELKNNNVLSEELAEKVLAQFDKVRSSHHWLSIWY